MSSCDTSNIFDSRCIFNVLFYLYIRRDYNGNKLDQCLKILEFTLVTKNLIYKKIEGNSRKKQFLQEIDISVVLDDVVIGTLNPDFINKSKSSNR